MYFKVILSAVLIFGCGYIGILLGRADTMRARQLDSLNLALKTLEINVSYQNARLSEALSRVCCADKTVENVFICIAGHMKNEKGLSVKDAWRLSVRENEHGLYINEDDTEIMLNFMESLGSGDRDSELNNIKMTRQRLTQIYDEARERAAKNSKLYKSCGFLIGAMAALILI